MILDKNGNRIDRHGYTPFNVSAISKAWAEQLIRESRQRTYFDKFIGQTFYDQFDRPFQYWPEAKGNVIEIVTEGENGTTGGHHRG